MIYRFDDYELDISSYKLRRDGIDLHIEPKAFDVLVYLVQRRGQLVSKEELYTHLWPEQYVSDSSLTYSIRAARKVIGDSGRTQRIIKTIHGRGYSFIAAVEELPDQPQTPDTPIEREPSQEASDALAGRRQVTVLWGSMMATSTTLSSLDPEELHDMLERVQTVCRAEVQRHGGFIIPQAGPGLLAYFGYPHANENDAHQAVRAGLSLVQTMQAWSQKLEQTEAATLTIRVALHTGIVLTSASDTQPGEVAPASGVVSHIATQLGTLAQPNTVVMSPDTARLVQGYFIDVLLGEYFLEELSQSIDVYQVERESGVQSRLEAAMTVQLTPFVGRDQEIGLLQNRWEQVIAGIGHVVLLSGDAGIGKSRLMQVFDDHLPRHAYIKIECRCSPYTQHNALYPIIDYLQRRFQLDQATSPEDKWDRLKPQFKRFGLSQERAFPVFSALFSLPQFALNVPPDLTPAEQRRQTLEALLAWILSETEQRPVYFVMEDLHWADPSTLEWLGLLMDHIPAASMLAVLTFRPTFRPMWESRSYLIHLALGRLTDRQTEELVLHVTQDKALPAELIHQILEKTDGVPLFVEEMTHMVIESGLVKEENGNYELADTLQPLSIPSTLHDLLMARLDRLGGGRRTVQLAAAVGREFSYELIQSVTPLSEDALQEELALLVKAELLYQRGLPPQAQYVFKHVLIQDAAYQSMLRRTRRQYHQQIAQVLAAHFPDIREAQPELVAHHFTEAGRHAEAIGYWRQAAKRAEQNSAYLDAIAHAEQGLAGLAHLPAGAERDQHELSLQLVLGLSLLFVRGPRSPDMSFAYSRAHQLCERIGDTVQLFSVMRGLWMYHMTWAELSRATELSNALLELSRAQDDPALVMVAHRGMGTSLFFTGDQMAAASHFEQGLTVKAEASTPLPAIQYGQDTEARLLMYYALNQWLRGFPEQALQTVEQAYHLEQQRPRPHTRAWLAFLSAWLYHWRREPGEVQRHAEASLTLCSEIAIPVVPALGTVLQGWAQFQDGRLCDGIDQLRQQMDTYQESEAKLSVTYMISLLAELYRQSGEIEAGLKTLEEALRLAHASEERWWEAELYRLQGRVMVATQSASGTAS